ncbi:MAG: tannase/feruloyl esterase family alpha/beta hydrolase [Burkholderiales bacterium]|nr:tannase/feruloyl esterase family alpha/beta hydrolase [Burkholderiales bacterium]
MKHRPHALLLLVPAALLLASCSSTPPASTPPVLGASRAAALRTCEGLLAGFRHQQAQVDAVTAVAEGALKQGAQPMPAHCLVRGSMHKRKGSDGRDYAIGFEMRLPQAWNGRFYYQGNGGLDGNVQPALGTLGGGPLTGALFQGFAVISSDAGHTGAQTPYFGLEPQARLDYGYQAVAKLTPMAKDLIRTAYGKGPDRSYIGGCSNGGRHAMVAAARLGEQYDGYLIGAPGYRLPNAALAQLWGAQQFSALATPGATAPHPLAPQGRIPDLSNAFTAQERQTVAQAILTRCDALDGARDGMVQDVQACQARFNLQTDVPSCGAERNGQCLSTAQKQVIGTLFSGARSGSGQPLYAPFPYDSGLVGANWGTWKFVNSLALDPLAVATVFSVPPGRVDALKEDLGARLALFNATDENYKESGLSLMTPPGHEQPGNLAPLRARGAKMLLYHGVSDAVFSAEDTRLWIEALGKALGGPADDFARYFPVPGMNHCSGGPATDQFDLLGPLVQWVEQGVTPQGVPATARGAGNAGGVNTELPQDWSAARGRPLCAYPAVARYKGEGSLEEAGSFVCQ